MTNGAVRHVTRDPRGNLAWEPVVRITGDVTSGEAAEILELVELVLAAEHAAECAEITERAQTIIPALAEALMRGGFPVPYAAQLAAMLFMHVKRTSSGTADNDSLAWLVAACGHELKVLHDTTGRRDAKGVADAVRRRLTASQRQASREE